MTAGSPGVAGLSPPHGLRDVEVVAREHVDETVDGTLRQPVVRERLRLGGLPGERLAVERTAPVTAVPGQPTVILVHGFAQNRFSWRISGRSLPAYLASHGFSALNLELRGHGDSRTSGAPCARTFDEYVVDLRRLVDRCETPPFVVGHSLGGAVGIGVAAQRPLRGLVHLAGVYHFARHNRALRALAAATLAFEPALTKAPARFRTAFVGRVCARLYAVTDIAGYGAPIAGWVPDSIERPLLEERLRLGFDWTSIEVWLEMARWATGEPFPYEAVFRSLDLPLLVVAGDSDPLVRPADARATFAASGSTDKELLLFDSFDHEVHWGHIDLILGRKAPRIVWPELLRWLKAR